MSWVPGTDASDFGLDNLPLGMFAPPSEPPRPGVAIGDFVADLAALAAAGLIPCGGIVDATSLNALLALGNRHARTLRARLRGLLGTAVSPHDRALVEAALVPLADASPALPVTVGDYVDFYSSIEHATNVGRLFRPDNPLNANYRFVPIGYHGRASSLVIDGTPIARPRGQRRNGDRATPIFGPTTQLDFELELGAVIATPSVAGRPIPIGAVGDHLAGYVLLNDWSARDLQAWESVPLGPFTGKSFATSISPWIVSFDALAPFRVDNRAIDPPPLAYLATNERWAFDIELEVTLQTARMRTAGNAGETIVRGNFRDMYWHVAQQLAHLTCNGARVRAGDLLGSGTVSGTAPGSFGSLLEATYGGHAPITLANGETRAFLHDEDTIEMRAVAVAEERRVGFGRVRGTIVG